MRGYQHSFAIYLSIFVVFFTVFFGVSKTLHAQDLSAVFIGKEKQAAECFYGHVLQMQFGMLDSNSSRTPLQIQRNAETWQQLIPRLIPEQNFQAEAVQQAMLWLNQEAAKYQSRPHLISQQLLSPILDACDQLAAEITSYDNEQTQIAVMQKERERDNRIELARTSVAEGDIFAGLFEKSMSSKFYWNWHSSVYANVRTTGSMTKTADDPRKFSLKFDSKITKLCVDELQVIDDAVDGYVLLLAPVGIKNSVCEPKIVSGLLYLSAIDEDPINRRLYLRLYDEQKRLVTSGIFKSEAIIEQPLDNQKLSFMQAEVRKMEEGYLDQQASIYYHNFTKHPDYLQLAPFYKSCKGQTTSKTYSLSGSNEQYNPYCMCLSYKFGVDKRIPKQEYLSYIKNFSALTRQFSDYSDKNSLYTRLNDTCLACSSINKAGAYYCNEADANLYSPNDYQQMITIMTSYPEKLNTSRFYIDEFFRTYLQAYSVYCPEKINNPVKFDYIVIEHTSVDPWAGTTSDVIQHTTTYVEPKYANNYKRAYDDYKKLSPSKMVNAFKSQVIRNEQELRRRQSDIALFVETQINNRVALKKHLQGNCDASDVIQSYKNLALLEK